MASIINGSSPSVTFSDGTTQATAFTGSAATLTSGTLPVARLPAGTVLQVVQGIKYDTFSTTSQSFTSVTGLSVNITPTSATSKILIIAQVSAGRNDNVGQGASFKLSGGNTSGYVGTPSSSRVPAVFNSGGTGTQTILALSMVYLDSPATTSQVTYGVQGRTGSGSTNAIYVNRSVDNNDNEDVSRCVSSITVMEIAA